MVVRILIKLRKNRVGLSSVGMIKGMLTTIDENMAKLGIMKETKIVFPLTDIFDVIFLFLPEEIEKKMSPSSYSLSLLIGIWVLVLVVIFVFTGEGKLTL